MERVHLNGDAVRRLPGNVNFSFEGVEGESLLLMLDALGICASSGSACTSGSLDPSHVLLGIGLVHEVAHGSLRLTFSDYNTMEDVDYILETLPGVTGRCALCPPCGSALPKHKEAFAMLYSEKVMDHFTNPETWEKLRMPTA